MNNWTIEETKELFDKAYAAKAKGEGLSATFALMAEKTGHSVNSVRNYYYSQLKMFALVPEIAEELDIKLVDSHRDKFVTFGEEEVDSLVRAVLTQKAAGKSVRRTIAEMSDGDARTALRLQNKYRSMLVHHKKRVQEIMNELSREGVTYYDPFTKRLSTDKTDNVSKLGEYIKSLDEGEVGKFLNLISKLI